MQNVNQREKKKILWVEDDLRFVSQIMPFLDEQYDVTHWSSLENFQEDLLDYHAALVDLSFIIESFGENFIEHLQKRKFSGAIIVFSADESISTKVRLLSLGVHDYLWKTMTREEVLLRVSNAIKRVADAPHISAELAGLKVDILSQKVFLNSQPIPLTRSEFRLLVQLMTTFSHRCHFDDLRQIVWDQTHVDRGAQDTLIWKLNKKLQAWPLRIRREGDIFELQARESLDQDSKLSFVDKILALMSPRT